MNATHEEWRPVVGHEGLYEVSNRGHVRSVAGAQSLGGRRLSGKVLKPRPTPKGYLRVQIRGCDYYIQRLVLEAFVGPCPEGMEACHHDSDRSNNWVSNLRWDTRLGNCQDIVARGSHWQKQKTECPQGHKYDTEWNHWMSKATGLRKKRACKTCHNDHARARYHARKSA